jgi:hypothetical protein
MSILMPNKNPIEAEILGSNVDPSAAKKYQVFLQNFDIEGLYQKSGGTTRDFMF